MNISKKLKINKIEKKIYLMWEKNKCFKANYKKKKRFSIIMPPPNITGSLHIGHAFQQTIMDVIIRFKKMSGYNTLWITGTDHAGISTQIIVEKNIKTKKIENISKKNIIKNIWKWNKKYTYKINKQIKLLGNSIDWDKKNFSLDEKFSYAVKKIFISLYKKKLIYKKKKIVNWDKKLKTVISDLEINKKKIQKKNYYIKYYLLNKNKKIKYLLIPTTNPETILGNTAIAVNPYDKRYKNLINEYVINPINQNHIKIISDSYVNPLKGTGCIKITPAHNVNDYKLAKKHKLNIINILNKDGSLKKKFILYNYLGKKIKNNNINLKPPYNLLNIDIEKVKKKIVFILLKKKLIKKIKNKNKKILYSNKSNSLIIFLLTNQWYLKIKNLAKKSINVVKKNKIDFIPKKYKKIYLKWMYNIKDWCISRQIYWGHKIPIWYDKKNKKIYTGFNKKEIYKKYKLNKNIILKRDKNVLDTWFSSSIWTFTSLGWPKKTIEFNTFHPINLVVSGFDIIFFWISRMIMITLYSIKKKNISQIPFYKIFITGLIRDENGKKMSKSIGNVINPIDIINGISLKNLIKKRTKNLIKTNNIKEIYKNTKRYFPNGIKAYGIDTLRFTLASIATHNIKINFNINSLSNNYNFCNKLWNACRYIILIFKKNKNINKNCKNKKYSLINLWITIKINILIKKFKKNINKFRLDLLCKSLFKFIKHEFCDWYLEFIKICIKNKNIINLNLIFSILLKTTISILKIVHPITPFITEYLWGKIKKFKKNKKKHTLLIKQKFPIYKKFQKKYHKKIYVINIIKKIIYFFRKLNLKYSKKYNKKYTITLIIFNISLKKKYILLKNYFLFKNKNINKIFVLCKKNNKNKHIFLNFKKTLLIKNIYLYYKLI